MTPNPTVQSTSEEHSSDAVASHSNMSTTNWLYRAVSSDTAISAGLFIFGFLIAFWGVKESGEVWINDGARYLNNGAMVHDWINSGRWLDPLGFARDNYIQFPAHSVPYHPPGYAVMLGIWFKIFGLSYVAGRAFIAVCLGISLLAFRQILLVLGESKGSATICTLIFGSLPQVMIWSRTCMSELPGLVFVLWATYFFLVSLRHQDRVGQAKYSALAIAFAMTAFMCRVSTAGVLPAWYFLLMKEKGIRQSITPRYALPAFIYLLIGYSWIKFSGQFSKNEMRTSLSENLKTCLTEENVTVWWLNLPDMVSASIYIFALIGVLIVCFQGKTRTSAAVFWILWTVCYYQFQVIQNLLYEARYFLYALPGIVGLVSVVFRYAASRKKLLYVCYGMALATVAANCWMSKFYYPGLLGYESIAELLGSRPERGNIVITAYADADLIFHLRCQATPQLLERQILRGDRILAIRNPLYSGAPTTLVANTNQDVYDLFSQGRVRFVVTEGPLSDGNWVDPEEEIHLCHKAMLANPQDYELLAIRPVTRESQTLPIYIWMYRGELQEGKSTLPIIIPTAGLEIK